MTTTTTVNVPLSPPIGGLSALPVRITDRDMSVDASPQAATFNNLAAGTWKVNVHISSAPATGAGASYLYTITSAANATSLALAPTTAYHSLKDFESGTARTIYVTVEVFNGSSRVSSGTASFTASAAPAARTDQTYALQIPPIMMFDPNQLYGGTGYSNWHKYIDAAADIFQPVAGHPERNVIRCGIHWVSCAPTNTGYDANVQAWMDDIFSYANGKGIGIMADLAMVTPAWARATPPWGTATMLNAGGTSVTYCAGAPAPDSWTNWQNFVNWFVSRYCTRGLTHVQCGNEPNAQRANNWRDTDAHYALSHDYLGGSVQAAVAATVGAFPVKVGLCNLSLGDLTYLQSMANNGLASSHFDAVSWHPYNMSITTAPQPRSSNFTLDQRIPIQDGMSSALAFQDTPGGADAFMDQAAAIFPGKPFWVTETGLSFAVRNPNEPAWDIPEAQGADQWRYLLRRFARMPRVDMIDIWGLYDYNSSVNQSISNFGLMRHDNSHRPAYAAVKQAIADIRAGTA